MYQLLENPDLAISNPVLTYENLILGCVPTLNLYIYVPNISRIALASPLHVFIFTGIPTLICGVSILSAVFQ